MPEDEFTVADEESVAERSHLRAAWAHPEQACPLGLTRATHRCIERMSNHPPGVGDLGEQVVGVVVSEECRHRVMVLAQQPVTATSGDDMDRVTHVEQQPGRGDDLATGSLGEPRLGQGGENGEVSQATLGLLDLRFRLWARSPCRVAGDQRLQHLGQAPSCRPRQSWATVARAAVTSSRSPATQDRSSNPMVAVRSAWATERHWATVRTLWSSFTPASQIGYQIRSASALIADSDKTRPLWSSTRSTSLSGPGRPAPNCPPLRECDTVRAHARRGPTPQPVQPGPGVVGERGAAPRPRRRVVE